MNQAKEVLAATTRALLHYVQPGASITDDEIYREYIAPHESALVEAFSVIDRTPELDELSANCLAVLESFENDQLADALIEGTGMVTAMPRQQGWIVDLAIVSGVTLTVFGRCVVVPILLAARIQSEERSPDGTTKKIYNPGLPKGTVEIISHLSTTSRSIGNLFGRLKPGSDGSGILPLDDGDGLDIQ